MNSAANVRSSEISIRCVLATGTTGTDAASALSRAAASLFAQDVSSKPANTGNTTTGLYRVIGELPLRNRDWHAQTNSHTWQTPHRSRRKSVPVVPDSAQQCFPARPRTALRRGAALDSLD